jgi:hypothetical protein
MHTPTQPTLTHKVVADDLIAVECFHVSGISIVFVSAVYRADDCFGISGESSTYWSQPWVRMRAMDQT